MKTFLKIVSAVGTVLWALAFFFGFNYYIGGSLMVSIPCAIFLALILGGSIYLAVVKSYGKDKVARNTERLALCVYVLFSLLSVVYVGHFVDVTANKQEAIRTEAMAQMDELSVTFYQAESDTDVPVAKSYEDWVASTLSTYRVSLEGETTDPGTIETRVSELRAVLLDDDFVNLQNNVLEKVNKTWYDDIFNWRWLTVSDALNGLKENKKDWEDNAKVASQAVMKVTGSVDFFTPVAEHKNFDINDGLTTIDWAGCFGWQSILLIVVLQFMMIFVYFAMRTDRASGAKRYKGTGVGTFDGSFFDGSVNSHESTGDNNRKGQLG